MKDKIESYVLHAAEMRHRATHRLPPANVNLHLDDSPIDSIYGDGTPEALTRQLDLNVAVGMGKKSKLGWAGMHGKYAKQISPRDVRGMNLGPIPKYIFSVWPWGFCDKGKFQRDRFIVTSYNGNTWRLYTKSGFHINLKEAPPDATALIDAVRVGIGYQCFSEYCWHVDLFFESEAMGIRFPVSDETLTDLAKMRDRPAGKKRLDSLLHTVSTHTRVTAHGKVSVNRHMRGSITHIWQGCHMRVLPAVNDLTPMRETAKIKNIKKEMGALR
jgi:hypothetical protein